MTTTNSPRGARNQQVARAGEHYVAAELNKRGAFAVTFAGNMPKIDLIACNDNQSRTVHIQVKTCQGGGRWHTSTVGCEHPVQEPKDETMFWVFVDLGQADSPPQFWIVEDWRLRTNICEAHERYRNEHGGQRPGNPGSTHHLMTADRLESHEGDWEILGILPNTPTVRARRRPMATS